MTISLKCNESVDEAPTTTVENFLKLTVNIGAGVSTYMATDIQAGLTQQVEKNSISLNRNSIYTQVSRVSRLPYYLVVNFVRFQWKSSENIRAKILKRVKFPHDLDVYDFCTPELQEKLKVGRNRVKQLDDINAELKKTKVDPNESAAAKPEYTTHDERAVEYQKLGIDSSLIGDVGCNVSGWYDLVAVLTHVGRTADSGHYVGWVKNQEGWFKYDDEKVSQCSVEDIAKLEGGGDWHSAYICLYKAKDLK